MKNYRVTTRRQQRTLTTQKGKTTVPLGAVASHELMLPWNLDVWYGLYADDDIYWGDDDE